MLLRFQRLGRHGWFDGFPKPPTIPSLLSGGGSIQGPIKVPNGRGYLCMIRNRLAQNMRHHAQAPTGAPFLFDRSPFEQGCLSFFRRLFQACGLDALYGFPFRHQFLIIFSRHHSTRLMPPLPISPPGRQRHHPHCETCPSNPRPWGSISCIRHGNHAFH